VLLCQEGATLRNLNPSLVYPLIAGSVSIWDVSKNVYGPTGIFIGTGAQIKANAGLSVTLGTAGLESDSGWFYTGLMTNFATG
jgi:hypothetical protein